jgi:hypothetical protein
MKRQTTWRVIYHYERLVMSWWKFWLRHAENIFQFLDLDSISSRAVKSIAWVMWTFCLCFKISFYLKEYYILLKWFTSWRQMRFSWVTELLSKSYECDVTHKQSCFTLSICVPKSQDVGINLWFRFAILNVGMKQSGVTIWCHTWKPQITYSPGLNVRLHYNANIKV